MKLDKLDDLQIVVAKDDGESVLVVLPKEFKVTDFKKIEYHNDYILFVDYDNNEKKVLLNHKIKKLFNNVKNIFLIDINEESAFNPLMTKIVVNLKQKENDNE